MFSYTKINLLIILAAATGLYSCSASGDDPGVEYAPQMYHSIAYEPLTQITDKGSGKWLSSLEDSEVGEFYNSNPNNPHGMTMREPVANTVRRTDTKELPYRVHKDSIDYAAANVKSPLEKSDEIANEGMELYNRYCVACHGGAGQGDGAVGQVFLGVPSYSQGRVKDLSEGHIFHTITYGKGRMMPHGSQVSIQNRWKIVQYVQKLQQQ